MIVVDASAMLEVLLRTPAAASVERRLFKSPQTIHAPHLIDVELAQVIRRYAATRELDAERGRARFPTLPTFRSAGIRTIGFCCVSGNCGTMLRPVMPYTSPSRKRLTRRCLPATGASPLRLVIMRESNSYER